jgi:hypothetical protein
MHDRNGRNALADADCTDERLSREPERQEPAPGWLLTPHRRQSGTEAETAVSFPIHERTPMDRILVKAGNNFYATASSH